MRCSQCRVAYVNGTRTHEHGCPLAHAGTVRECKECGCEFEPESRQQVTCSHECFAAYYGEPVPE
jgi:hypothetical protein